MRKGTHHTAETKEKIRLGNLGKKYSKETREKIRLSKLGHSVSPETREKICKAHLGKPLSTEHKNKISKALLGNQCRKGISHSEKTGFSKPGLKHRSWGDAPLLRLYPNSTIQRFSGRGFR